MASVSPARPLQGLPSKKERTGLARSTRPPEAVAPFVAYLASAACTVSGEAFSVGFGRYARVFVGEAPGWVAPDTLAVGVEDVAAHIDQVRDTAGYSIPENLYEEMEFVARSAGVWSP